MKIGDRVKIGHTDKTGIVVERDVEMPDHYWVKLDTGKWEWWIDTMLIKETK